MISGHKISQFINDSRRKQALKLTVKAFQSNFAVIALLLLSWLSLQLPAMAHHGMDGMTPSNFWEGFLSGLGHPVIGLDHLAFVVAIGLLSAGKPRSALIPLGFVLAALAGTGIHLLNVDLPSAELVIAASVIVVGTLLTISNQLSWVALTALGAVAGLFHGYAYGEAIIGAEMTPLVAYLFGFTLIQYGIILIALLIGSAVKQTAVAQSFPWFKFVGLAICSIGVVFFTSSLVG